MAAPAPLDLNHSAVQNYTESVACLMRGTCQIAVENTFPRQQLQLTCDDYYQGNPENKCGTNKDVLPWMCSPVFILREGRRTEPCVGDPYGEYIAIGPFNGSSHYVYGDPYYPQGKLIESLGDYVEYQGPPFIPVVDADEWYEKLFLFHAVRVECEQDDCHVTAKVEVPKESIEEACRTDEGETKDSKLCKEYAAAQE